LQGKSWPRDTSLSSRDWLRGRPAAAPPAFVRGYERGIVAAVHPVHDEVLAFIDERGGEPFETLALAVFRHQFESIEAYRGFCLEQCQDPETVTDWRRIPPVPIQAFKQVELCCDTPQRTFLSSGTTRGPAERSRHYLPDVRLYRRSAVAGLRRFLFPDVDRIRILSLVHPVELLPDSSLAQMVSWAMESFGEAESAYAIDAGGIDFGRLVEHLRAVERSGQLCCLMTTTAALLRLLDHARQHDLRFRLPHGSRLMDTGGDKGAPRRMSRHGILHACWNTFAIPGYFCVNEYGMTELSSQCYDNVLSDRARGVHRPRCKVSPPWMRTLVLDPETLSPVAAGEKGLLCHYDLANAGSALGVLTEDVGYLAGGGFEVVGRASSSEARGCSLALAEWISAEERGSLGRV
jgi:hypothetical protein